MNDTAILERKPHVHRHSPTGNAQSPRHSLYVECRKEEEKFKWIESEKVGYDLGEQVIQRWVRDHWSGYLRARWLEHLQGKCFWIELDRGDFALLEAQFLQEHDLLDPIVDRLKSGKENLDIIDWAVNNGISCERVLSILEALDMNSTRLQHQRNIAND